MAQAQVLTGVSQSLKQQQQPNGISEEDQGVDGHRGLRVGLQPEGDGGAGDAVPGGGQRGSAPHVVSSSRTAGTCSGPSQDASSPHATEDSSTLARGWAPSAGLARTQRGGTDG